MKKFQLFHDEKYLWDIIFKKGTYQFKLNNEIDIDEWNNKYGILPLSDTRELSRNDLFEQLNVRLPIYLRKSQASKKNDFIEKTSLKVISDGYQLKRHS